MVDYREILRLKSLGYTMKDIASSVHSSRNEGVKNFVSMKNEIS